MIHMGSDHRSVVAQICHHSNKERSLPKIQCDKKKMITAENTSHSDDVTRFGEATQFEERYAELERKIKYKAEIAATIQEAGRESLTMSKQAEGVVDAGITALPCWSEDTNDTATMMMGSGKLGAVAEAIHHSSEYANAIAAATESEHEEVRLVTEDAAALHLIENAFAESTEFGHADERIVVRAVAALDLDEDASIAAARPRNLSEENVAAAKEKQREGMSCRSGKKTKLKKDQ